MLLLFSLVLASSQSGQAQNLQTQKIPKLALLFRDIYGPDGLVVDSEDVLPDGTTHSGHFNSGFQSEFTQFNVALAGQLTSLPLPSPASGFTYAFDTSTGTFKRSTQSFGPILAERAETIGKGKFSFGFNFQQFAFTSIEGIHLSRVPAVFRHDTAELGGGRSDVVTTSNTIEASVSQFTSFLTYGIANRLDISVALPLIRTHLALLSDAVIQRIGTAQNPKIHFFRDPSDPTKYGTGRQYFAEGTASGMGDVIVRLKGTAVRRGSLGLALGTDVRVPSGDEQNLLGSGAVGVKPFAALSFVVKQVAPHLNAAYQWNGQSELAGDVKTGTKEHLPDRVIYVAGADIGVNQKMTLALDILGQTVLHSPRVVPLNFVASNGAVYPDIKFRESSFSEISGSTGVKINIGNSLLANFNLLFRLNDNGLRYRVAPLFGIEYGF
jgi:hypothetical protein